MTICNNVENKFLETHKRSTNIYESQAYLEFSQISAHLRNNDQSKSLLIGITLEDIRLDWLNCFFSLVFGGILLLIPIGFMLFLSPYLDPKGMPMASVSLLRQLGLELYVSRIFYFKLLSKLI